MNNDLQNNQKTYLLPIPDPGKPLQPHKAKLSRKKRKEFLQFLSQRFNKTLAATKVGVTIQSINDLLQRDPKFKNAYDFVLEHHLDNAEEAMFIVASSPTREGFNDRKLALTTHRRGIYGERQEINLQHNITVTNSDPEIRRILSGQGENIEEAEYEDISK